MCRFNIMLLSAVLVFSLSLASVGIANENKITESNTFREIVSQVTKLKAQIEKYDKTQEVFRNIHNSSISREAAARTVRNSNFNMLRGTVMLAASFLDAQNVKGKGDADYWSFTCDQMAYQGEIACMMLTDNLEKCNGQVDPSIHADLTEIINNLRKFFRKYSDCVGGTFFWERTAKKFIEKFKQSSEELKSVAERFEPTTDKDDCISYLSGTAFIFEKQKVAAAAQKSQFRGSRHFSVLYHEVMFGLVMLKHVMKYSVNEFPESTNEMLFKLWEDEISFFRSKAWDADLLHYLDGKKLREMAVEICDETHKTAQKLREIIKIM